MADKNQNGKARPPDFNLWAITDTGPNKTHDGRIGTAWLNDDGSINIILNPFVTVSALTNPTIKLFPIKPREEPIPY